MTEDGEVLRRRLYRPGAEDQDVAAYLAAAEPPPPDDAAAPPAPVRRPPTVRLVVAGVAALAVAAVVLGGALRPAAPAHSRAAPPAPLPTAAVAPQSRAAFVRALDLDGDAGLASWSGAASPLVEQHGEGPATVALPLSPSRSAGRITVLLVLATDATAGWTAARFVIHDDRTIHLSPVAGASGTVRAGIPAVGRFAVRPGERPQRLLIRAPTGARWGVAAVWSSTTSTG